MVQYTQQGCLKGGVWHSKQQLIDQLMDYIKTYNLTRAKPFDWTYNPNNSSFKDFLHQAVHNGGVIHAPKTNYEGNPLHERLYINISHDVHKVFPTIDNPSSQSIVAYKRRSRS